MRLNLNVQKEVQFNLIYFLALAFMIIVFSFFFFSGQKKASTAKNGKRTSKAELSSDERFVPHLD